MHLQKKLATVILVLAISAPALAMQRDERSGVYDRIAKFFSKIVRSVITNGDGLIPPIP